MVSIGIIITQSSISGIPGESREDIVIGSEVKLSNIDIEVTSYKWEIIGKPYTSTSVLNSTTESEVYFTPDVIGSYLIQLTINNQLKQRVVAAILTSRYGIRIPASGEGEEIYGGSFKAITEAVRTLEEDSLNAAKIQGKDVSLNDPGLNDLLRFNGEEYVPSGKLRTDDVGFRNTQNVLVKIPLSSAIPANPYWEYSAGTSSIKPCWKTIPGGGALPVLDFSWNAFPHGSVLKKIYIVASCTNIESNSLTVKVGKRGAAWEGDEIVNLVDQFISTTTLSVDSISSSILTVDENTPFTHGNGNDDSVVSEELSIRITTDGNINHTFRIFGIYAHFQTLSIGLYNGPLVAEGGGGGGQEDGGGCCFSPAPFDFVLVPTTLTEEQNGEYFFCVGFPYGNGQITLPLAPTSGLQFTIMCAGGGITIDGNGIPMAGPMGLDWGAFVIGLESESSVTLTAKDLSPLSPGDFAWVITGGIGEFFNNDVPTERFNFNFNPPSTFSTDSSAEFLGWTGSGIFKVGKNLYSSKLAGTEQHGGGTPVDVGPTDIWKLIESGHGSVAGTSPVVCTLDGFANVNDDGWECTFMVGVDSNLDPVPMTVKCPTLEDNLCIEGARYVNSITANTPGAFVRIKFSGSPVGRGQFEVLAGRGTWTDNLSGIHNLTGSGSGHNPVTLADSAITGGLSLNDQEIGFRAATTSVDGYLKSADWNTFNSKEPAVTKGDLTSNTTSVISITDGTEAVIGTGTSITINKASAIQDGYLGKDDFASFISGSNYAQTVTVAKSGGQHTTINSALSSITDATANKKYVIKVYPGVYNETITLKDYVDVVGIGPPRSVVITSSTGTVVTASNSNRSDLRNLTITRTSTTSGDCAIKMTAGTHLVYDCAVEQISTDAYGCLIHTSGSGTFQLNTGQLTLVQSGSTGGSGNVNSIVHAVGSTAIYVRGINANLFLGDVDGYAVAFVEETLATGAIAWQDLNVDVNVTIADYNGIAAAFETKANSLDKYLLTSRIKVRNSSGSKSGIGKAFICSSSAGGAYVNATHNTIDVTGFESNYLADINIGDTLITEFNTINALHGAIGDGNVTNEDGTVLYHGVVARSTVAGLNCLPTHITTTTFTLGATSNPITYYYKGVKCVVVNDKTVVLDDGAGGSTAGLYFVYFSRATGTLLATKSFPGFSETSNVIIATVYWNGSNYGLINDERHGYSRDKAWHQWSHNTVGTRYNSGLDFVPTGTGETATFTMSGGVIWDEDIVFSFSPSSGYPTPHALRTLYQTSNSTYVFDTTTSTIPYRAGTEFRPTYVKSTGYVLTTADAAPNNYFNFFIYGTTDLHTPLYCFAETVPDEIATSNGYSNETNARAVSFPNLISKGLSQELKPLYRLIVRANGDVQSLIPEDDYRLVTSLPMGAGFSEVTASAVSLIPVGDISSTNVQSAIEELDFEKEPTLTKGDLTESVSSILTVTGGTESVIGSGTTIQVKKASLTQDGYLGKDDFATFAAGGGGGDGYWSRDSVDGYLRPIITTDAIMVDKIGVGVSIVDSSAVVDIASTTKGILPPRMTTTQRNAIVSPVAGLQIFNTTTGKDNTYNGSSWEEVASGDVSSWSGTTTDGSVTELFLGGITNARYTLQANSTTVFQLLCVARDGTNNKSKVWKIEAVAQRDSSDNSSVVGTPTYTVVAQSDISGGTDDWDILIEVNDTDETFRVSVTGATSTSIAWTIRG